MSFDIQVVKELIVKSGMDVNELEGFNPRDLIFAPLNILSYVRDRIDCEYHKLNRRRVKSGRMSFVSCLSSTIYSHSERQPFRNDSQVHIFQFYLIAKCNNKLELIYNNKLLSMEYSRCCH